VCQKKPKTSYILERREYILGSAANHQYFDGNMIPFGVILSNDAIIL
jgi:hypothetical protein